MAEIEKGVILTLMGSDKDGNPDRAAVQALNADGAVSMAITIPWYLRGSMGNLSKGTKIAYAVFDDASGVILSRMDGEWGGKIDGDVNVKGISIAEHTHGGVEPGSSRTDVAE